MVFLTCISTAPRAKFDRFPQQNLLLLFTAQHPRDVFNSWNIQTHRWLQNCKRLSDKPSLKKGVKWGNHLFHERETGKKGFFAAVTLLSRFLFSSIFSFFIFFSLERHKKGFLLPYPYILSSVMFVDVYLRVPPSPPGSFLALLQLPALATFVFSAFWHVRDFFLIFL